MLASLGREFAYNDPQAGFGSGEGAANDQNVELLVKDPRRADLELVKTDTPDPVAARRDAHLHAERSQLRPLRRFGGDRHRHAAAERLVRFRHPEPGDLHGGCRDGHLRPRLHGRAAAPRSRSRSPRTVAGTIFNKASVDSPGRRTRPNNSDTEQTVVRPGPAGTRGRRAQRRCGSRWCRRTTSAPRPTAPTGPALVPVLRPAGAVVRLLTVGTPDANGRAANSIGSVRCA